MPIKDYLFPENRQFDVVCKDDTMHEGEISRNLVYRVLGAIQGFFLMKNNKGIVEKYYRDRFKILEKEDDSK